uniref:Uncharacterized protein n=1 Tax=Romanomermis culicivorax TaxID=13658 RepID=A0A915K2U8_ROMCU
MFDGRPPKRSTQQQCSTQLALPWMFNSRWHSCLVFIASQIFHYNFLICPKMFYRKPPPIEIILWRKPEKLLRRTFQQHAMATLDTSQSRPFEKIRTPSSDDLDVDTVAFTQELDQPPAEPTPPIGLSEKYE